MKRWAVACGLLGSCLITALPAAAEWPEVYLGAGGGLNFATDSDLDAPVNATLEHEFGWGAAATVGLKWLGRIRTEFEFGWRTNDVESIRGATGSGRVEVASYMANLLYDVPTRHQLAPYFGIGGGLLRGNYSDVTPVNGFRVDDSDTAFGYQGIAGLNWKLNDVVTLFTDYRYTRASDFSFGLGASQFDADWSSHAVFLGVRVALWKPTPTAAAAPAPVPVAAPAPVPPAMVAPPPAPAPVPAPAAQPAPVAPRVFVVFFEHDKADLTFQAKEIITEAAGNAKRGGLSRLMLTGHADRSGSERYNLGLSERRANTVRDELVRQGVQVGTIATDFRGESQLLVPTADGVREPQNRRVEIKFN
ncbi:MAG: hypothetical protein EXQ96_02085 [Alphaproteobacteria bacterium]|nr:hypothetical protein [Alphaproteobacteria bacterium]